jgi:hypothetical protein
MGTPTEAETTASPPPRLRKATKEGASWLLLIATLGKRSPIGLVDH